VLHRSSLDGSKYYNFVNMSNEGIQLPLGYRDAKHALLVVAILGEILQGVGCLL
jgi:hypothetical protein